MKDAESTFAKFLLRNSVKPSSTLPLIHSTRSYHLASILNGETLSAGECDVFHGEKLNYFFVGRPAYKSNAQGVEGAHWEFPCCFIFEFEDVSDVKRIFPFDSGAFSKKLYPDYIKNIDINHFSVSGIEDAPSRIIGAFFGDVDSYLEMKPKPEADFGEEFSVGALDAEVKSLHRLTSERSATTFDDRRFTIEVQSGEDINLALKKPLAVIAPSEYFEEKSVLDCVVGKWGAEPISYKIFSLSVSAIYGEVYSKIYQFYVENGII